jgi:G3E family GTPase
MQFSLNELLKRARPDRLLIEPTGLGHPKEVLQVLSQDHYQDVLDIQKTVTLVDARKLADARYTQHETFNQQIAIADIVVGNKVDLYKASDKDELRQYVAALSNADTKVVFSQYGEIEPSLLTGATLSAREHAHHHHHHAESQPLASELAFPESGFIKAVNSGEGYVSVGWRFSPKKVFNLHKVREFVINTDAERIKAVFITYDGIVSYNKTQDGVQEMVLDEYAESRVEIIAPEASEQWSVDLFSCL